MSVVSHGYGGFGGGRVEVVDGMHAGQGQVVGRKSVDAGVR